MFKHGFLATLFLVLAACSPAQVQFTPTPEITQTNTLTPTQTETPEPTPTFTVTPSPTATITPAQQYREFPATLDLWLEEMKVYCDWKTYEESDVFADELSELSSLSDYTLLWVPSMVAGEVVNWTDKSVYDHKGPSRLKMYAVKPRGLADFCSGALWSLDQSVPLDTYQWFPFESDVVGGYYGPTHPDADENGMVMYFYDHP
ncbi:MAG: hypothetical protein AB1607_16370 [Chloroflexota bacterium]